MHFQSSWRIRSISRCRGQEWVCEASHTNSCPLVSLPPNMRILFCAPSPFLFWLAFVPGVVVPTAQESRCDTSSATVHANCARYVQQFKEHAPLLSPDVPPLRDRPCPARLCEEIPHIAESDQKEKGTNQDETHRTTPAPPPRSTTSVHPQAYAQNTSRNEGVRTASVLCPLGPGPLSLLSLQQELE